MLFLSFSSIAQNESIKYDKALADSLGADEYGMKSYYLVILKTGSATIDDEETLNKLFEGHIENIDRLAKGGKIVVAGPFGKNDNQFRGLFIFDAESEDEVKEMLQMDPAIAADVFETEIYPWYGSAALPVYLDTHQKISKENP